MHLDYWRLLQRNEEMLYSNDEFFLIWVFSKCTIIFYWSTTNESTCIARMLNIVSWKKRKKLRLIRFNCLLCWLLCLYFVYPLFFALALDFLLSDDMEWIRGQWRGYCCGTCDHGVCRKKTYIQYHRMVLSRVDPSWNMACGLSPSSQTSL